jgi:twitching motility protein PilT
VEERAATEGEVGRHVSELERELANVLIDDGRLSLDELREAVEEQRATGASPFEVLVTRGVLTERDIVRAHAAVAGLAFVDLSIERPDPAALETVPAAIAAGHGALPVRLLDDGALVVALNDPRNHAALDEIAFASGRQVVPAATYGPDLAAAIERAYAAASARTPPPPPPSAGPLRHSPPGDAPAIPDAGNGLGPAPSDTTTSFAAEDLPLVETPLPEGPPEETVAEEQREPNFAEFLETVIETGASDLHLTSGLPPMMRVHGEVRPMRGYRTLQPKDLQELIYSILNQKQRETFEENLELDVSYALPGRARFRVNVFRQRDSLGSVMRLIPFEIRSIDDLGLPPSVAEFAKLRRGLVLVTGITGSGKSTTLAGLIDIINTTRPEHIMTVEDPIEFLHHHKKAIINQREVGTDTHGFAQALRHVLRQDPDVILVGEMRDLETIQTALTAAETGHVVFGTLHTQDAPQSVDRVIDVFPPHQQQQIRVQLAGTLAGIVSQQLLVTADGNGRAVAAEVLVATPAVRNLIREGKTHQIYTSMQAGGKFGMQVMDQHLAQLVKSHKVTYESALEHCHHVEEFNRLTGKAG